MDPTKECKRCHQIKPLAQFSKAAKRTDGLQAWCKTCVKENDHRRYMEDKKKHRSWNMKRKDKYYDMVTEYLLEHPCVDCGESNPIVLEFDHRDPTIKDSEVTRLISYASWERVEAEMNKCDVVCSNCHRKRTAKQFGWRRWRQQEETLDKEVFDDAELDKVILDN